MPTNTYTPIGSVTLATATSSVTFTVPTGYRDLIIVSSAKANQTLNRGFLFRFNNDSGSNYSSVAAFGYPNSYTSISDSSQTVLNNMFVTPGSDTSDFATVRNQIMDYSATDKHKTILTRLDFIGGDARTWMSAGRWASNDAITSIEIYSGVNSFASGSTFNLYGIVA